MTPMLKYHIPIEISLNFYKVSKLTKIFEKMPEKCRKNYRGK
jgi:hypothetical protein